MSGSKIKSIFFGFSGRYYAILFFFIWVSPCLNGQKLNKEFISVVSRSNFIFYGTVVFEDSSNINVRARGKTCIVKVDEVIDAVTSYYKMKGREVTVLLADSTAHSPGNRSVFYTTGWYYGKTLGVKEVNNTLYNKMLPGLKKRIAKARQIKKDNLLASQLNRAVRVIRGRVLETNLDSLVFPPVPSEHDPRFRAAVIKIGKSLKGDTTAGKIKVYYASSYDIMWENSPKLTENMEAVFLLHQGQAKQVFTHNEYTLLDPRDVQPVTLTRKIKKLLKK